MVLAPYGQEISYSARLQTTACPPNYRFTGYEYDYAFARYYSARLGRFLSTDPLGGSVGNLQSHNAYAYTSNDPMNTTDPSGMGPTHGRRHRPRYPPRHAIDCTNSQTSMPGSGPSGCGNEDDGCSVDGAPTSCGVAFAILLIGVGPGAQGGGPLVFTLRVPGASVTTLAPTDDPTGNGDPYVGTSGYFEAGYWVTETIGIPFATPDDVNSVAHMRRENEKNIRDMTTLIVGFNKFFEPAEVTVLNGMFFFTGTVLEQAGVDIMIGTCTAGSMYSGPFACAVGIPVGSAAIAGGGTLFLAGGEFFRQVTVPAYKEWWQEFGWGKP